MTENATFPPPGTREDPPELPEVVSLLPLRNSVLFPGSIIPIDVGRPKSVKLIEEAIANERPIIGIVTRREARVEEPSEADLHSVGCAARILKVIKLAKDNYSVILQGVMRIQIEKIVASEPFLRARATELPDVDADDVEAAATHQYWQVGNAVSPFLVRQVAAVVADLLDGGNRVTVQSEERSSGADADLVTELPAW